MLDASRVERPQPAHEQAYALLKRAVLYGELKAGERLVEEVVAGQLGVSRTPVREALRRLQQDGLVVRRGGGLFVPERSPEDIAEIYTCRSALESLAASLAAQHATPQRLRELAESLEQARTGWAAQDLEEVLQANTSFHGLIVQATDNRRLLQLMAQIQPHAQFYRSLNLFVYGRTQSSLEEHETIYAAIRRREPEEAAVLMRAHLLKDRDWLLRAYPDVYEAERKT